MKEISVSNSYLINEKVYDLDIKFYQVSSIAEPVEVFDTVSITHLSTGFSGLVIEIKTKDFVYPNYFYNLNIKLYEDILTDSISLSLYQLSSVEFPTLLPTPIQTINQSIESTTSYEYRDLSIGTYLTSPNTTYYFLLYKEPISEIVRYSLRLNLTENTNKMGKINVTSKYDSPLPQYLKYDNNDFENTNIRLNLYNGKYILSKPLLTLPGKSLSTNIILTYNSYRNDPNYIDLKDITYLRLRNNWNLNYIMQLKKHVTEDKFLYIDGYGEHYYFTKVADNTYVNTEGRGMYLIKNFVTYELYDKDNNRILFNSEGYAMSIKNQLYTLDMIYAEIGNQVFLDSIKDSSARVTSITYESSRIIITKPDNKEIIITYGNSGVTSVVDEYGQTTTYTYNTNKNVAKITKGIYSLDIIQTEDEVTKLLYNTNNTIKYTKEYQYSESSSDDITTITMYKNTKSDNNQIIRKYCFNSKGDYIRDYEDIGDGKKYDENKRQEDLYEAEVDPPCSLCYRLIYGNDNHWVGGIDTSNITGNFIKTFTNNYITDINQNKTNYQLKYRLYVPYSSYNELHDYEHKLIVNVIKKEIGENNVIEEAYTEEFVFEKTTLDEDILTEEKVIDLNLSNTSNTLELNFEIIDYNLSYFAMVSCYIEAQTNRLPPIFINEYIESTPCHPNMPFLNNITLDHKSENVFKSIGYALKKPDKIRYVNTNDETILIENFDISVKDLITNLKNIAYHKNIFWYNNYKSIIVNAKLHSYAGADLMKIEFIYGEKVIAITEHPLTLYTRKNDTDQFVCFYADVVLKNFYNCVVKLDNYQDNIIDANTIIYDDKQQKIYDDYTNRIIYQDYEMMEYNYININKIYNYDTENCKIEEITKCDNIYSSEELKNSNVKNFVYGEISKKTYQYDSNNNFLVQETKDDNVSVSYQYNVNNGALIKYIDPFYSSIEYVYNSNDKLEQIYKLADNNYSGNEITYENELTKSVLYKGYNEGYGFDYNSDKQLTSVSKINKNNNSVIETYEIVDTIDENNILGLENGYTGIIIAYATGEKIAHIYDKYERLLSKKYYENNEYKKLIDYIYAECSANEIILPINNNYTTSITSKLKATYDYIEKKKIEYYYDSDERLTKIQHKTFDIDTLIEEEIYRQEYIYEKGLLIKKNDNNYSYEYTYGRADKLQKETIQLSQDKSTIINYVYDSVGNLVETIYNHNSTSNKYIEKYIYNKCLDVGITYSEVALQYKKQFSNELYAITYDKENRITKITNKATSTDILEYTYDGFGNITEETNRLLNKRFTYTYNEIGNIIQKETYDLNNQMIGLLIYTYDSTNSDELMNVNDPAGININISYTNRYPNQINNNTLIWEKGTNLKQYKNDTNTYTYYYNANNIRYKKALTGTNNITIEYNLSESTILEETRKQDNIVLSTIKYIYSGQSILGFIYTIDKESTYYAYEKDILNNIVALYKIGTTTELVATYIYDAWGNHTVYDATGVENTDPSFIGNINPFRYKGYYYDVETNLFLVSSRYYSPELCRWISPDDIEYLDPESVNGLNLYCYCFNDPINYIDPDGHFPILALVLTGIALVGMGLTGIGVATDNNVLTAVGLGMVGTAALVSGIGALASGVLFTGVVGGITTAAGVGSLTFMSAEITEAVGAGNWIQDVTGWSDSTYNTILLSTAAVATLGTAASSFASYYKVSGIRKYDDYLGIKFQNRSGKTRVLSFHTHGHKVKHGLKSIKEWHWQIKKWNPMTKKTSGDVASYIWWNLRKIVW